MDNKKKVLVGLLVLIVTFGAGFFARPAKVKTETKEVVKTVTVKVEGKTKILYREWVDLPDGTHIAREHEEESSTTTEQSQTEASRSNTSETTRDSGLTLQALAIVDIKDIRGDREYGLYAKKRVFANVSVGALITSDKKIGLGIGLDF